MASDKEAPASPVLGLALAVVGLAWLGANLGVEPGRVLGTLWPWPVILLVLGFSVLVGGRTHSVGRGLGLIVAGLLIWAIREHLLPVPYWRVAAPSVLAAVGVVMVWRSMHRSAA